MTKHPVIRAFVISLVCVAAAAGRDDSTRLPNPLPLTDLGRGHHESLQGGLYPQGLNMVPGSYRFAGFEQSAEIAPLDLQGRPADTGRIGVLMLGTANTRLVAERMRHLAEADAERSAAVVMVNATAGTSIAQMARVDERPWSLLPQLLATAGVARAQVQVVWLDATSELLAQSFPGNTQALAADLEAIVRLAQAELPNLRVVYVSSGVYAGYGDSARGGLDSYESGFAVKQLVEQHIAAADAMGATGAAPAPWVAWGPYLWADGATSRSDGLVWNRSDFGEDGVLLSTRGAERAATQLLEFLHVDAMAKSWFLAHSESNCQRPAMASTFGHSRVGAAAPSIAASALPMLPSLEPLWIAVSGAPASTSGLFLAVIDPQGSELRASGPVLISPESAHLVPVTTDAQGRAWMKLGRVPIARESLCGLTLCVQFVCGAEGALVASPGLRLQGGH